MPDEFDTKVPIVGKPRLDHLNRQIPPLAHTPMYNWHKFWSRKTWNVVAQFIRTYCPKGGIAFDPFAGSGVVAIEALRAGRRAIVSDLLPISSEITRLTIKPVSETRLYEAYQRVEAKVKDRIFSLYQTQCRNCGHEFPATCAIWTQSRKSESSPITRKCIDIRYIECPKCGDRREGNTSPTNFDKKLLQNIEKSTIKEWYPKQKLYHINGRPFIKKEKYESLDELFTKRNLQALAWLMEAIEEEPNRDLRDFLEIGFTSMVHLCSSLLAEGEPGYRPFSGVGWNQQSYWFVPRFMESNVWDKFKSAIMGKQGLISAKKESNKYFQNVRFAKNFEEVFENKADVFIYNGSCFDLIKEIRGKYSEAGCIDYIFTDPPYDASVQYGELAYLWVCWLKKDKGYLAKIASDEVVRNERQDKDFSVYHSLLARSFKDMYGVLKPDNYLTVTFHNPTFKIRNATIYAGVFAGFEFQKIHHQELARPSAKSLLQPFGSAQGDFYLRFYKPPVDVQAVKPETIDERRFEKIVVETAIRVIAERGEPTPYTIIINAVDPELARRGFFSELHAGLDVKTVLERNIGKEFVLVSAKLGGAEGKMWWFTDPSKIVRLESVPLSERVEQTVLRKLRERGRVTFTEVWDAVSSEFPNSHTTDSMSIRDALEAYARQVPPEYWVLKPNLNEKEIEKEHTTIIAILAEMGRSQGFKIWVGKIEQSHKITALPPKSGELRQYVSYKEISRLKNIQNPDVVEDIDLLWIKNDKVESAFEIESTTSMTSGLQRGSNVESSVPKYLVIPEDREGQLLKKLKTPLFGDRFKSDSWRTLYFNVLKEAFGKHKSKVAIKTLVDKKIRKRFADVKTDDQQPTLFK